MLQNFYKELRIYAKKLLVKKQFLENKVSSENQFVRCIFAPKSDLNSVPVEAEISSTQQEKYIHEITEFLKLFCKKPIQW